MTCRKSLLIALVALTTVCPVSPASAREAVPLPSPADVAAALHAARAPAAISFVKTNFRQVHGVEPKAVTVADHGVPAYVLNPDFVRGRTDAPAGVLQYIAVTATADTGVRATVRADPAGDGRWAVGSVFSGDDEEALSKRIAPGSVLLNEPQINGWYELTPAGVVLLRASLPQTPVGEFVPLAEYQEQVHARYADKLPGSDYQEDRGIGFTQPDATRAEPEPTPAVPAWSLGASAVLLLVVGLLWWQRSRRKSRSTPST
ncbi:hypothetical protein [Saccharothrix obliqua]|uniref:hypothetical protein n=1 Tax=Saccharothrix obliqua TaxID=2861747 RepID=UPI001C5E3A08|nr:hypothetical protein [Saccharothrix obliqua]MBW4720478.1 hypothetical protein [Saccharothrix obliqua]